MNNLLEKARAGRTNALASIATNLDEAGSKFEASGQSGIQLQIDPIPFISRRAQSSNAAWLH